MDKTHRPESAVFGADSRLTFGDLLCYGRPIDVPASLGRHERMDFQFASLCYGNFAFPPPGSFDNVSFSQKRELLLRDDLILQVLRACFSRALLTVSRAFLVSFVCKHDLARLDVGDVNARVLI